MRVGQRVLGIWKPSTGSIPGDLRAGKEQTESTSSQGLSKLGEFFFKVCCGWKMLMYQI